MLDQLQAADFSPLIHQTLTLRFSEEVSLPAELMEVREVNSFTPLDRKPFAIVVRTDQKTHYYNQTIAVLEHPEKGDLPLFFVPVGFDGQGMLYEAVFA
ncbi:MAG: hypothetical protein IT259_07880 [Saprospiraceae bacterium]|nr:hypothetical protein [Saprospiraceae bacterium]